MVETGAVRPAVCSARTVAVFGPAGRVLLLLRTLTVTANTESRPALLPSRQRLSEHNIRHQEQQQLQHRHPIMQLTCQYLLNLGRKNVLSPSEWKYLRGFPGLAKSRQWFIALRPLGVFVSRDLQDRTDQPTTTDNSGQRKQLVKLDKIK